MSNEKTLEEKLTELREKYERCLREGRTEDATEIWRESERLKNGSEEVEAEDEGSDVESEETSDDFTDLKGVGEELAVELEEEFGSLENMAEASAEDLEPIPGIGSKRAENLLDQLK